VALSRFSHPQVKNLCRVRVSGRPCRFVWLVLATATFTAVSCDRSPEPAPAVGSPAAATDTGFAVIGDYGTGNDAELEVARQLKSWMASTGSRLLVTTGDNAYPFSSSTTLQRAWEPSYGWTLGEVTVLPALGNHDVEHDGGVSTIDYFSLPGRWYEKTVGDVDFFVLDANRPDDPTQAKWLVNALAASESRWKVAVFHQPAFSCSFHDGDPRIVDRWVPIFERYGVDLVLSGHDHNYQRFTVGSTPYVVTGGGGAELYPLDECPSDGPPRVAAREVHHFLGIDASPTEMTVKAIDAQGKVLDTFTVQS
jgi:3',5'-cyclic AMP phosphodiesterase CpdA